jgi:hypothetical protein
MEIIGLLALITMALAAASVCRSFSRAAKAIATRHEPATLKAQVERFCEAPPSLFALAAEIPGSDDELLEMLAELFTKTDEEVLADAEIASLHTMLVPVDPRPERANRNS